MKTRGRGGPPVLVTVLLVPVVLLCLTDSPVTAHQILWGRCYSHCMRKHLQLAAHSDDVSVQTPPKHPIRACQRHTTCRWCLYVCDRPEENFTNSESCRRDCRLTRTHPRSMGRQACTDACGFVGRASSAKGGTCPAPVSLNGFKSACVTSCHGDRDCSEAEEKCCNNGCGSVCTAPYDIHILPPVPSNITFKLLKTGGVMVKWGLEDSDKSKSTGQTSSVREDSPVVYILRWWCHYTSGAITAVTDRARTRLQGYPTGIYPEFKCHFMVAAVNVHGSRGFSKVSPYTKKLLIPSPPLNLEKDKSTLHDGKVDVTIQWQPPVYTDGLPVFRYEVFWSDSLPQASPSYMRLHMHRHTLPADKLSFVLRSLEPGTIYFVQVRAVVRWKKRRKKGKPASTYIETYHAPIPAPIPGNSKTTDMMPEVDPTVEGAINSIMVNQTFFHNTILKTAITWTLKPGKSARKYLIYWQLTACAGIEHRKARHRLETSATSHERSFTLYNLQPDCEYSVRVHPVNRRGRTGAPTVINFLTPPCHVIEVVQGESPVCHTANPPGQVKGLHSEMSGCITVVRWELPSKRGSHVDAYDIMWGETEAGAFSTATIVYTSAPHQVTLPANATHMQLGQLTGGQHYTIQVSARSVGGSSQPAILHISAHHLQQPCGPGADGSIDNASSATSHKNTSDINGSVSISRTDNKVTHNTSLLLTNKNLTGDVSWNKTHDISIELNHTDGESVTHEADGRSDKNRNSEKSLKNGDSVLVPTPTPRFSTKDFSGSASRGVGGPAEEPWPTVNTTQPSALQPPDQSTLNTQVSATDPSATSPSVNVGTVNSQGVSTVSRDTGVDTDFSTPPLGETEVGGAGVGLQVSLVTLVACLLLACSWSFHTCER